LFDSL
jgi:hypothetical protein